MRAVIFAEAVHDTVDCLSIYLSVCLSVTLCIVALSDDVGGCSHFSGGHLILFTSSGSFAVGCIV